MHQKIMLDTRKALFSINFNVTKPDSWKIHMVVPYVGVIASVNAYLDGYNIYYVHDGKGQYYFSKEFNLSNSGLHNLNITVLSYSYYTGPAYNNSSYPFKYYKAAMDQFTNIQ